jgi:hypothetical protein
MHVISAKKIIMMNMKPIKVMVVQLAEIANIV